MRKRTIAFLLLCLGMATQTSLAHHPGGSTGAAGSTRTFNPFVLGMGGLRNSASATFDWSHLDNGAGDFFMYQVSGEYAVWDRLSFLARIPIVSLQLNFRPDQTGLGDIVFGAKGLVLSGERYALHLGNDFSFPSGDRDDGTGVGAVTGAPYLSLFYDWGAVSVFTSAGVNFLWDEDPEPRLDASGGVAIPLIKRKVPVTLFASLRSNLLFADEVFTQGSFKLFVVPGVIVYPSESQRISITISGKVAIADELSVKTGQILTQNNLALVEDVFAGVTLDFTYTFK